MIGKSDLGSLFIYNSVNPVGFQAHTNPHLGYNQAGYMKLIFNFLFRGRVTIRVPYQPPLPQFFGKCCLNSKHL